MSTAKKLHQVRIKDTIVTDEAITTSLADNSNIREIIKKEVSASELFNTSKENN